MPIPPPEMWATTTTVYEGCVMRMQYKTTNHATTNPTNDWRTVLPLREAPVSDTPLGKPADNTPGWWMQQGGAEKWFATHRIICIKLVHVGEALSYDDCPHEVVAMASIRDAQIAAGVDRGASPDRHPRSRSRSRSRSSRSAS
eukprot:COSAG02_NODE_7569_length_2956_cov_16.570879_3_plen_142_part_01